MKFDIRFLLDWEVRSIKPEVAGWHGKMSGKFYNRSHHKYRSLRHVKLYYSKSSTEAYEQASAAQQARRSLFSGKNCSVINFKLIIFYPFRLQLFCFQEIEFRCFYVFRSTLGLHHSNRYSKCYLFSFIKIAKMLLRIRFHRKIKMFRFVT